MNNHLWLLLPWAVFALAAGVQFWRITQAFRKRLQGAPVDTERFRRLLERTWQKDEQSAS